MSLPHWWCRDLPKIQLSKSWKKKRRVIGEKNLNSFLIPSIWFSNFIGKKFASRFKQCLFSMHSNNLRACTLSLSFSFNSLTLSSPLFKPHSPLSSRYSLALSLSLSHLATTWSPTCGSRHRVIVECKGAVVVVVSSNWLSPASKLDIQVHGQTKRQQHLRTWPNTFKFFSSLFAKKLKKKFAVVSEVAVFMKNRIPVGVNETKNLFRYRFRVGSTFVAFVAIGKKTERNCHFGAFHSFCVFFRRGHNLFGEVEKNEKFRSRSFFPRTLQWTRDAGLEPRTRFGGRFRDSGDISRMTSDTDSIFRNRETENTFSSTDSDFTKKKK